MYPFCVSRNERAPSQWPDATLQVIIQCMISLFLGAFGVVLVAGKLQVKHRHSPSRFASAYLDRVCKMRMALLQPISLSAILDGASPSFEDFNPERAPPMVDLDSAQSPV